MLSTYDENKHLIERYPFLMPRNRFTDETPVEFDYRYTELDSMPCGWRKAFGEQMCEEIREELLRINCIDSYRIIDIKEKYGVLRWYGTLVRRDPRHDTKTLHSIIQKYEALSARTCIKCGEPATKVSVGWISPYCDVCAEKIDGYEQFMLIDEWFAECEEEL